MNEVPQGGKPVAEVPYSPSRIYLPNVLAFKGGELHTLPSGARYVRMPDGSLRKAKVEMRKVEE